jgi:hypothetical protein
MTADIGIFLPQEIKLSVFEIKPGQNGVQWVGNNLSSSLKSTK